MQYNQVEKVDNIQGLVHPHCVVCSYANMMGLHLQFEADDRASVKADFQCHKSYQGYPGMVHGGVISSILDGAMGHCMFARGQAGVTIELTIRFRHPVKTGHEATVSARVTRSVHPVYLLEAEISQDGEVKATAKAKYYDQPKLINTE